MSKIINQKGFAPILGIIIAVIALAIAAGGAWYYKNKIDSYKTIEGRSIPQIQKDETADWKTYKNEQYGFQLKFPLSWGGYRVSENSYSTGDDVCFVFDRPSSLSFCILQIGVFTPTQWESYKNEFIKRNYPEPIYIAKNNQFYFVQTTFYSSECVQLDKFQCARSAEQDKIISTFKFIK